MGLLAFAAGFALFFILLFLLERDREVRRFWLGRVAIAAVLGVILARLSPLWTKFDDVLGNPMILITADLGIAAFTGGAFAFAGVVLISLVQLRRLRKQSRRWTLLTPVGAGLLLALGLVFLAPRVVVGPPELSVSLPDLEGRKHTLAEWKGKITVLNFWATWCPPCVAELPDLKQFASQPSNGVVVLGINALGTEKGGAAGVVKFAADNHVTWTQLTDPKGELQKDYQVGALPTTVVLDAKGQVIGRREGVVDQAWLNSFATPAAP